MTSRSAPATGAPSGAATWTSSVVSAPGVSWASAGVAVTSSTRLAVDTGSVTVPVANAGRSGAPSTIAPSAAVRGVEPATSIDTLMFGTSSSPTATGTIAEPSTSSNVAVDVTGPRSVTISPVPAANGACTSSCAVWPGRYSSASGTRVRTSWSTVRLGIASAPLTQRVVSLRLTRPASSVTVAVIR